MAPRAKDESLGGSEDHSDEKEKNTLDDKNFGCGRNKSLPKPKDVKPGDRLSLRRRNQMDRMKDIIHIPPRSLPLLHLPSWPYMHLDQKLPVVRSLKGTLFYSRGSVGQKLYQTPKRYSNEDPYNNYERVISEPYNALHDPHAKSYLQKPHIQKFLLKQGLITTTSQVICTVKDFNKYRAYLNTLYTDDVLKVMGDSNEQHEGHRKVDAELSHYLNMTEGKSVQKTKILVKRKREMELQKIEKITMKQKMDEDRQLRMQIDRDRIRRIRIQRANELDMMRKDKLTTRQDAQSFIKERIIQKLIEKEARTKERIAHDKQLVDQAYNQFMLEWMDTKWQTQEDKMEAQEILENSLDVQLKEKSETRQKHTENYRSALPEIVKKQRTKRERLWNIVRKYFNRWVANVRKRKASKPDAQHQSLWETSTAVDETLKYLRKESGYEKLDDFILSIIKLKRDIKAEIELEEKQEAESNKKQEQGIGGTGTHSNAPPTDTDIDGVFHDDTIDSSTKDSVEVRKQPRSSVLPTTPGNNE